MYIMYTQVPPISKMGVFSVDISGVKHDYYLKGSEAYKKALKQYGYK